MSWDKFVRAICFLLGVCLVVAGFTIDPVRGTEVIIGLVLMGIISLEQVRKWSAAWARDANGNGHARAPRHGHAGEGDDVTEGMQDATQRPIREEPPL